VNADGVFVIYVLTTLNAVSSIAPVKGVTTFSYLPLEGAVSEIAMGKKKTIALYELTDRLTLDREVQIGDTPVLLARSGSKVCFADDKDYALLDVDTREAIPLIPFDTSTEKGRSFVVHDPLT
jgi:hypothetical protein